MATEGYTMAPESYTKAIGWTHEFNESYVTHTTRKGNTKMWIWSWVHTKATRRSHDTVYGVRCTSNRGRLLLWTPGPTPFWTCRCSNVETIFSDLLSFKHPSVLLFCLELFRECVSWYPIHTLWTHLIKHLCHLIHTRNATVLRWYFCTKTRFYIRD